jgi:hypothetical protein
MPMERGLSASCAKLEGVAVEYNGFRFEEQRVAYSNENYVSAKVAAEFLDISETFLTRLARNGQIPAHPLPIASSGQRRTWRFKLSELRELMERSHPPASSV